MYIFVSINLRNRKSRKIKKIHHENSIVTLHINKLQHHLNYPIYNIINLPTRSDCAQICYLLALISLKVCGVDAKYWDKWRCWGRHTEPEVNGVGTTECSVVSQSLEGDDCVLRKRKKIFWIISHYQYWIMATKSPQHNSKHIRSNLTNWLQTTVALKGQKSQHENRSCNTNLLFRILHSYCGFCIWFDPLGHRTDQLIK